MKIKVICRMIFKTFNGKLMLNYKGHFLQTVSSSCIHWKSIDNFKGHVPAIMR